MEEMRLKEIRKNERKSHIEIYSFFYTLLYNKDITRREKYDLYNNV